MNHKPRSPDPPNHNERGNVGSREIDSFTANTPVAQAAHAAAALSITAANADGPRLASNAAASEVVVPIDVVGLTR